MDNNIYVCGMYRSGTTFLYNMINRLKDYYDKPWKIHKVHQDWLGISNRLKGRSIYSYRDIRDVVASFCYKENMNFNTFRMHDRNIKSFLEWIITYDRKIKSENNDNILYLKYEDHILNTPLSTYNTITTFLDIPSDYNNHLHSDLHIDKQKERIKNSNNLDKKTLYWPNHIKDGKNNKYKDMFNIHEIELINSNEHVKVYLNSNGY